MILGIISDTHGHVEYTRPAVRMLSSCDVQVVIHCGDIGSPEIVRMLAPWPTHFVLGNCDLPPLPLEEAIAAANQHFHGRFGELEFAGRKIAFLHSDDSKRFQQTIESQQFDLVCYGHTHVAQQHRVGRTLVLNPGALYRADPHSLAIVRLPELEVSHINL